MDGNIVFEKAKKIEIITNQFEWNKRGKNKSEEKKSALYSIETLYKARNSVIELFWWLFFNDIWG